MILSTCFDYLMLIYQNTVIPKSFLIRKLLITSIIFTDLNKFEEKLKKEQTEDFAEDATTNQAEDLSEMKDNEFAED